MTLLTDALALTKPKTDPTPASPAEIEPHEYQCSLAWEDCGDCSVCGHAEQSPIHSWAARHRGFGSNVAPLAPGVKRVPRA